jgi:hypothetical protein
LIDVHIEGVAEDGTVIGKKIEDARTRCS